MEDELPNEGAGIDTGWRDRVLGSLSPWRYRSQERTRESQDNTDGREVAGIWEKVTVSPQPLFFGASNICSLRFFCARNACMRARVATALSMSPLHAASDPTTVGGHDVSPQPTKPLNIVRQTWRVCIEQENLPSAGRPPGGQMFLEEI